MNKMNILSIKIENERAYMISLAEKYGYTSEVVLKISQELDKLIHQYQIELLKKTKWTWQYIDKMISHLESKWYLPFSFQIGQS